MSPDESQAMKPSPPRQMGRRRASIAGLLALIAAVAVATAWFHEESKWDSRWAVEMLGGFALAAAIVTLGSPSLTDASIRVAVGSAVLLTSVAWVRISPHTAGWHYRSPLHWVVYWALATVALPMLLGPGLRRLWAASGREKWVRPPEAGARWFFAVPSGDLPRDGDRLRHGRPGAPRSATEDLAPVGTASTGASTGECRDRDGVPYGSLPRLPSRCGRAGESCR